MIFGLKAQYGNSLCSKKDLIAESIKYYEKAIELDPHDDTAHLYCALEYANWILKEQKNIVKQP
nr:unnamed protein product [Meloidogyne enterolobii]